MLFSGLHFPISKVMENITEVKNQSIPVKVERKTSSINNCEHFFNLAEAENCDLKCAGVSFTLKKNSYPVRGITFHIVLAFFYSLYLEPITPPPL